MTSLTHGCNRDDLPNPRVYIGRRATYPPVYIGRRATYPPVYHGRLAYTQEVPWEASIYHRVYLRRRGGIYRGLHTGRLGGYYTLLFTPRKARRL